MRSRQNHSPVGRFVPGMEALEDRTVPAGNVQVIVGDGVLYVAGDDAGNQIWIAGAGSNSVVIRSLDGSTTINGQSALFVGGAKRGYYIDLAGGDNVLMVTGTQANGGLTIKTGEGNDLVNIGGAGHRRETLILTGGGNDQLILNGQFRSAVLVNTGAGDDQVTANQVRVTDLYMMNPAGNDLFNNQGSVIGRPNFTGFTPGTQPPAPPTLPPAPPPPPPPPPPDTQGPAVAAALLSDTGANTTDKLTNDERINLTVTDASTIVRLNAGLDSSATSGYINILPNLSNGAVSLDAALLVTLNKNTTLTEGVHTLFIDAADSAGNSTLQQFTFTIDKTGAPISAFNLAPESDTGTAGDLITGATSVNFTGTTQAGVTVQVFDFSQSDGTETLRTTTTADNSGAFRIENFALHAGSNVLHVRSIDAAGNVITIEKTITRTTGPTQTAGANLNRSVQATQTTTVDLRTIFDTLVRIETSEGNINMTLFEESAPLTVANFLKYVNGTTTNGGNYNNSIFHRLDEGFVLQGGGFRFDDPANSFFEIPKDPSVNNEFSAQRPNTRGTIAMAKSSDPNSATSEFFFNLANNTALDNTNNSGGFTAFGKVSDAGLATLDRIVDRFNEFKNPGIPGGIGNPNQDLGGLPVRSTGANTASFPNNIKPTDLLQLFRAITLSDPTKFTFSATSSNPSVATVAITNTSMTVTGVTAGTTTITLTATDPQGVAKQVTFNITVT